MCAAGLDGGGVRGIHTFTCGLLITQLPAGLVAQLCHRHLVTRPLCASFPTSVKWEDSKTHLSGLP